MTDQPALIHRALNTIQDLITQGRWRTARHITELLEGGLWGDLETMLQVQARQPVDRGL